MTRRETGIIGEKMAREFLANNGYNIVDTNYRCRAGEVDIIAIQGDTLVFVEVRTKTGRLYGSPEESITPIKAEHMRTVALQYGQEHEDLPQSWRIDLVAIELDRDGLAERIELIENAVEDNENVF
jgi:putative endonuclease